MDCVFARRRFINNESALLNLFETATIVFCKGVNSTSGTYTNFASSSLPQSGTVYVFSVCYGEVGIWKFTNRVINTTPIVKTSPDYGGLRYSTDKDYYTYNSTWATGTGTAGTSVRGHTFVCLQFASNYSTSDIEDILTNMMVTGLSKQNSYTAAVVSTTDKTNIVYLATKASNADFWIPNGSSYNKIKGTSSAAATVSGDTLSLGSVNGGSILGFK